MWFFIERPVGTFRTIDRWLEHLPGGVIERFVQTRLKNFEWLQKARGDRMDHFPLNAAFVILEGLSDEVAQEKQGRERS
jgi:hypothetical protein